MHTRWNVTALLGVLMMMLAVPNSAAAKTPKTVTMEGFLTSTSGVAAADGSYNITFRIYASDSTLTPVWQEGPEKVAVSAGHFQWNLGSKTPLDMTKVSASGTPFLSIQISKDPELPREALRSSLFSLRAAVAEAVTCVGCIKGVHLANGDIAASKVGFNYAGSATKGGPATGLICTGCVSVKALKFDDDVKLGGNSLNAKNGVFSGDLAATTVTANSFVGDGSKLTGIKLPSSECKVAGHVVKGINANGTLKCVAAVDANALPKDGLNEISNNLLSNQFVDTIETAQKLVAIPDNTGSEAVSVINFPDIGVAQTFELYVHVENTNLAKVSMAVLPPDDKKTGWTLCDPCGSKGVKVFKKSFTSTAKPQTGDIGKWIGKNPKGAWTLKVLDVDICVPQTQGNSTYCKTKPKTDGWIASWQIKIQTLSNKKVQMNGDLLVSGVVRATDYEGAVHATGGLFAQKAAAAPAKCDASQAGRIFYDTKRKHFYGCNSVAWSRMDNGISNDIMTKLFSFSSDSNTGGNPKNVADHISRSTTSNWPGYCLQTAGSGAHWLKVDFGRATTIEKFAVQGYPGGSHKPSTTWHLQGSNNNAAWTNVWSGDPTFWQTGNSTYPTKQIITVTQPGAYRYYRVYGTKWTNGYLLMCNWSMYE